MSRVLIVGINYGPEEIGTGKYTGEMAEWLAARGHRVRVITAPPYYPAWKVWPGFSALRFRREATGRRRPEVIRCPLYVPRRPNGAKRLLHLGSFAVTSAMALLASLRWRPHAVICIAPTLAAAPAAWAYARLTGARCWLHIQDFEVDAALDMGVVRAGLLGGMARSAERWLLRRFDRVSTISEAMIRRLADKGVPAARRVLFGNWADVEGIRPLQAPSAYRAELGIPDDAVVALYSGNMGLKQGLELLGQAARRLAGLPGLHFVFGGEGPARAALEQDCAGLRNVHFLPLQPTERLGDWLGLADIHLLPQREDVADLVMPSKLTGMLASGRPVIATALPGTGLADAIVGCGLRVSPGNAESFVDAITSLACDRGLRLRLGQVARDRAVETLAREGLLLTFERRLAELTGRRAPIDTATPDTDAAARRGRTTEKDPA